MSRTVNVEALLAESPWVRRLVRGLVRDAAAAEDVLQETWVAALRLDGSRWAGRGPATIRAWLAAVARNLALRARRDQAVRRRHEAAAARKRSPDTKGDELERLQMHQSLAQAVSELEEPYRSAIVQRFLDERSYADIAARAGISSDAARQRVSRGLAKLRGRLEREYGEGRAFGVALLAALGPRGLSDGLLLGGAVVGAKTAAGIAGVAAAAGLVFFAATREESAPSIPLSAADEGEVGTLSAGSVSEEPERASKALVTDFGGPARAPTESRRPSADPERSAIGVLVTDRDGNALLGAWIESAERGETRRVVCDAEGRADLAMSRVQLAAAGSASGEPIEVLVGCEGFVEARASLSVYETTVVLARLPSVSGRLLDPEGRPIASRADVRLYVFDPSGDEERDLSPVIDPSGSFRLDRAPVGRLRTVWAMAQGYVETSRALDLELVPDAEERVDLVLEPGVVVEGVVLDGPTGEPLPGARVWADSFDFDPDSLHPHTVADDEGVFRLEGVEAQRHLAAGGGIWALLSVHAKDERHASAWTRWVVSEWREDARYEVELRLDPSDCALAGVLYEHGGRGPVEGVAVYGLCELGDVRSTRTDAEGRFRFDGLLPGEVSLFCVSGSLDEEGDQGLVATYSANLQAGDVHECVIELPDKGRAQISGRVLDPEGRALPGARVEAQFNAMGRSITMALGHRRTATDHGGRYSFSGLAAGPWSLSVQASQFERACSRPSSVLLRLEAEEQLEGQDFVLGRCISIAGTVEPAGHDPSELRLVLVDPRTRERIVEERVTADSTFVFRDVLSAVYELVLEEGGNELSAEVVGPESVEGIWIRPDRP